MKFINLFRSVPTTARKPHNGGTCWGCGTLQGQLERADHAWMELVVFAGLTGSYVTSEDGGTTVMGYNAEEDWYSFPVDFIVQWRWAGEEIWRKGRGYAYYGSTLEAAKNQKQEEKRARRQGMVVDGVDYEALLEAEGLKEIE